MYELLNNWKVVLLSIGGAATFWFFNALNKDYNAVINYPIEFQFARDSVVIMEPLPTTVSIDVSSGGWNLIRSTLYFNVTPIQIELENPTEIGYFTRSALFPFVLEQLEALEVNYLVTDTLYIDIEKKKSRKIRLAFDSLNAPLEAGYRFTSPISISPDSVYLVGPASFIDTLGSRFFLKFDDDEIDRNVDRKIKLRTPKKDLISSAPSEFNLSFEVEKFQRMKVEVEVEPINFPSDSSIYLSKSKIIVEYTIPDDVADDYDASDFVISANRSLINKKDSTVIAMLITYPEQATEVSIIPENIPVSSKPQ